MSMPYPTYERLKDFVGFGPLSNYATPGIQANPRLYKYHWRVFWEGSSCEGEAFLSTTPLSTLEAIELIDRLCNEGKVHLIFVERQPREGVEIWNYESSRLIGKVLAPAYDDDPDSAIPSGHK